MNRCIQTFVSMMSFLNSNFKKEERKGRREEGRRGGKGKKKMI